MAVVIVPVPGGQCAPGNDLEDAGGLEEMNLSLYLSSLERGGLAIPGGRSHRIGIVDDLIDGVDRLALAAAATNIEDPGDEMVLDVRGIRE